MKLRSPYCNCRELNEHNGLSYSEARIEREDYTDEVYGMFETILNKRGNCNFCNYVPVFMSLDEFKAEYGAGNLNFRQSKKI